MAEKVGEEGLEAWVIPSMKSLAREAESFPAHSDLLSGEECPHISDFSFEDSDLS